jgi:hypothetical protein
LRLFGQVDYVGKALERVQNGGGPLSSKESDLIGERLQEFGLVANATLFRPILLFEIAGGVGFIMLVVLALSWRPARVLVLRPFGPAKISTALRRVLNKNVRFFGHTITLSDRGFKPSLALTLLAWVPLDGINWLVWLLGLVAIKTSVRISKVTSERRFIRMKKQLRRRCRGTFSWIASAGGTFNVRCNDNWWQDTVTVLMASCDMIIIDGTHIRAGTLWELHRLVEYGFQSKCIFVARSDRTGDASAIIGEIFGSGVELFSYTNSGEFENAARFQTNVMSTLSQARVNNNQPQMRLKIRALGDKSEATGATEASRF